MSTTHATPVISAGDRLGLTLFLALAFHALVILGVGFSFQDKSKPAAVNTLDITLVHTRSDQAPDKADYLAQENQQGAGNTSERVRKTTPRNNPGPIKSPGSAKTSTPPTSPTPPERGGTPVLTRTQADVKVSRITEEQKQIRRRDAFDAQLAQSSMEEITRLEAETRKNWQVYSKRPNPKFLYANTRKVADAAYLEAWTRKVQRIGNNNYPDEARRKGLSGSLTMEVTLRPDGNVSSIKLLDPSNYKVLDDAAMRIVRLAAPFAPVPANVLDGKSELRIVRTWMFTSLNGLTSR